ncbi:slowpoke-binding protein isoform X3 [Cherax quadricarinatus]|uniref:slowpoke-binding protein isoform X3 n=1 Tax=Cherax quadricarinatus TaxID=27406 RepID=UPI002378755E|nr:slowpoke-binding protein-like isoform X3 [Cherax quadricarinatus]
MMGMYGQKFRMRGRHSGGGRDSPPTIGHDRVNYVNPTVNYDKFPRKIRPKKGRSSANSEVSTYSPERSRRCSCSENLNLTSEQLLALRRHSQDHSRDEVDGWLQQQQQTDEILHASADVLTRMFTCLNTNAEPPPRPPIPQDPRYTRPTETIFSRHGGRYSYSALEDEGAGERLEMERKAARGASRDTTALAARSYLRGHQRYSLLEHLRDIGSRIDKNWFMIRDASVKTDRLMTLQPFDEQCPFPVTQGTREALVELFQALHHPYIYPVLDVDFANISSCTYVITVIPHNNKGTLKDLIYRSHWQDDWSEKYQQRSAGLPVGQVQRLGRQVLEALLFLQDRGFPPCGHLHSGNVVLQNGVARLSGVENTLLGLTSRIYPIIKRRLRDNRDAIDSVCFGHVIFEMCAGYELSSAHPTPKHLEDLSTYPQVVQVLEYIFGNGDQYPSVEEILCLDFFRNLDLREMRAAPLPLTVALMFQIRYSPMIRSILKEVRRFQKQRRRGRRGGGTASGGEGGGDTPTSSEASASGGGGGDDSMPPTSAYNTPTASLAALSSPTSDVTPSPEHPAHRLLEVSSPQRQHPSTCQDVFHTPPHTPPTPQNHPIRANHISQAHNDRPLTTTHYPPRDSRSAHWSNSPHVTQNGHVGKRGEPWT